MWVFPHGGGTRLTYEYHAEPVDADGLVAAVVDHDAYATERRSILTCPPGGVGFIAGAASGLLGRLSDGLVFLVASVVLAAVVAGATLAWRLGEVVVRWLRRAFVGRTP